MKIGKVFTKSKRSLLILGISVALCSVTKGQYLDRVKGSQGIEVGGGISRDAMLFEVAYYRWIANSMFLRGGVYTVHTRPEKIQGFSIARYGIDGSFHYNFVNIKNKFFLNALCGFSAAFNHMEVEKGNFMNEDVIKFGFAGGAEVEIRLVKKFVGVVSPDVRYMFGESFGSWRFYNTLGLRYSF